MDKKEQQYLMDQLAEETFKKDIDEFSYRRVAALVQLMEVNEPTDSKEAEDSQKEFEKKFRQMTAKKRRIRINVQKLARTASAICILVLAANFTTEALMNDNVFHVIQRWSNCYEIIPSDHEVGDRESDVKVFADIEEFESYFGDDFLICSWLPDGYELDEITCANSDYLHNYIWSYSNKTETINIQMYNKLNNNIVSLTDPNFSNKKEINLLNGIKGFLSQNGTEYVCCFEYNDWWYTVYYSDENILLSIVEKMIIYEKN